MPRSPICRYGFFLFSIFISLFFLYPKSVFCLSPITIYQATYSADSQSGQSFEVDDEGDSLSDDKAWEDEWGDSDESNDDTEDQWAEEDTQNKNDGEGLFKLSGEARNKFAHDVNEDSAAEDDMMNHVQLKAGVSMAHGDRLRAVLFADTDYFSYGNDGDWEEDGSIRLDDAYVNFRGNGFNLKIGNQVIRWGKTDAYSPLDNLNPEDLRDDLSGRREDRKLPIPMAGLEIYSGNYTIFGVFIPFFIKSKYDLLGTDWAALGRADGMTTGGRRSVRFSVQQ